jgi:hypothetical protein
MHSIDNKQFQYVFNIIEIPYVTKLAYILLAECC